MIPLNKIYSYPALERVTHDDGNRYYVCPEGNRLSSVTTILSATGDKTGLLEWRAWVGDKRADQIRDEACGLGSLMHTHLENWMEGLDRPRGSNLIRQMASNMADVIINRGLCNVAEVWAMEEILYYPGLYAGTADLIGLHKGEACIMDYKTTNKMKTKDKIGDYAHQLAAYAMAHNEMYGTNITKGVIFMVSRDLQFEEFVFEGEEFQKAQVDWIGRVDTFLTPAQE
jgi:genome maintenance exonuclease 1